MRGKILLLYYHAFGFPMRLMNEHLLYCFKTYSERSYFYVNAAYGIPEYLLDIEFDVIIFHDLLLCKRSLPRRFRDFVRANDRKLRRLKGYKIATVQDEFTQTVLLGAFLRDYAIQHVFSTAPSSEWEKIYDGLDKQNVKFETVLTGYVDDNARTTVDRLARSQPCRDIDIGYRAAFSRRYSLGAFGYLKNQVAEVFRKTARASDLVVDVSTDGSDLFYGLDWYRFLLKCKYTIGVESGASLLDADGEVERSVSTFLLQNPQATFDEAREACFGGKDGNLELHTISPRHFEACMTRTCQILVEGDYNGILQPWVHYIPLKRDFSNLDEVMRIVKEDKLRADIVNNAYVDIIESGNYTYASFVRHVLGRCEESGASWTELTQTERTLFNRAARRERLLWRYIPVKSAFIQFILSYLSRGILHRIVRWFD